MKADSTKQNHNPIPAGTIERSFLQRLPESAFQAAIALLGRNSYPRNCRTPQQRTLQTRDVVPAAGSSAAPRFPLRQIFLLSVLPLLIRLRLRVLLYLCSRRAAVPSRHTSQKPP